MTRKRPTQAQMKRRQTYTAIGVMVAAVLLVIAAIAVSNQPLAGPVADAEDDGAYAGLTVTVTEDGLYRLGSPDAAVVLEVFSSFACPHCVHFHETIHELIDPYVQDGTLAVTAYMLANSQRAALGTAASICAGQQDPIKFWQMCDLVYSWIAEPYDQARIEEAASAMGLNVDALRTCMESEETHEILQGIFDTAMARSVRGTPATFFNGARPDCGRPGDLCEGSLPYDMVVQNIEQHLGAQ